MAKQEDYKGSKINSGKYFAKQIVGYGFYDEIVTVLRYSAGVLPHLLTERA